MVPKRGNAKRKRKPKEPSLLSPEQTKEMYRVSSGILKLSEQSGKTTSWAGIVDMQKFFEFLLKVVIMLKLHGSTFFDAGSGTAHLCPMVLRAAFAKYVGIEFDEDTAADSIRNLAHMMVFDSKWNSCLDHIYIVLGNILKLPSFLIGENVVLHSYLSTMTLQFSLTVHLVSLVARSENIIAWIFHSRNSQRTESVLEVLMLLFDPSYKRRTIAELDELERKGKTVLDEEEVLFDKLKQFLPRLTKYEMPNSLGNGSAEVGNGSHEGFVEQTEYVYLFPVDSTVRLSLDENLDRFHKARKGYVRETVTKERDGVVVDAHATLFDCDSFPSVKSRLNAATSVFPTEKFVTEMVDILKKEAVAAAWM